MVNNNNNENIKNNHVRKDKEKSDPFVEKCNNLCSQQNYNPLSFTETTVFIFRRRTMTNKKSKQLKVIYKRTGNSPEG